MASPRWRASMRASPLIDNDTDELFRSVHVPPPRWNAGPRGSVPRRAPAAPAAPAIPAASTAPTPPAAAPAARAEFAPRSVASGEQRIDVLVDPAHDEAYGPTDEQMLERARKCMARMHVAFVQRIESRSRSWTKRVLSRCVAWGTRRYSHAELVFSTHNGNVYSFRVVYGEPVQCLQLDPTHFPHPGWDTWNVAVPVDEIARTYVFCAKQVVNNVGFNELGLFWNFMPLLRSVPIRRAGESWFCSEMIMAALSWNVRAFFHRRHTEHTTSPDDLCELLRANRVTSSEPVNIAHSAQKLKL